MVGKKNTNGPQEKPAVICKMSLSDGCYTWQWCITSGLKHETTVIAKISLPDCSSNASDISLTGGGYTREWCPVSLLGVWLPTNFLVLWLINRHWLVLTTGSSTPDSDAPIVIACSSIVSPFVVSICVLSMRGTIIGFTIRQVDQYFVHRESEG